jgi:predicted PolB exonuclease-like 3'-5' exonuclease
MDFAILDIETRVDKQLLNRVFFAQDSMSDDDAYRRFREELKSRGGDFFPLTLHLPISIAVGYVSDHILKHIDTFGVPHESEESAVRKLWALLEDFRGCLVTFNGRRFDLPVLELAAVRWGISAPHYFDCDDSARSRSYECHLDLYEYLTNFGEVGLRGGMDLLVKLLGLPGKLAMNGAMVQGYFESQRYDEIRRYCRTDVIQTYFLFLRIELMRGRLNQADYQAACVATAPFLEELKVNFGNVALSNNNQPRDRGRADGGPKQENSQLAPPPAQVELSERPPFCLEPAGMLANEHRQTIPARSRGEVRNRLSERDSAEALPVSLIVITRNEEAAIGQCLASVRSLCRELVVVDSGSTDRTVEIARSMGAIVIAQEFTDYVRQKQLALDHASSEWVLLLDADEQATYELRREIRRAIASPRAADGYRIPRLLFHLRHYDIRAIYRDRPVRLFRRQSGHIGGMDPHDKVIVRGQIERLGAPILHFSYRDIADHVDTINRFSTRGAAQLPVSPLTAVRMFTHPVWYFFNFYVLRGGFLEGGRGLYAAITGAFYVFLKYAKVYERRLSTERPR